MKRIRTCISDFLDDVSKNNYKFESESDLILKFVDYLLKNFKDNIHHYVLEKPICRSTCCNCDEKCLIFKTESKRMRYIDLYYDDEKRRLAFEFKFHRRGSTSTADAKEILIDFKRLSGLSKKIKKFFIYVTDDLMNGYFSEREHRFNFYKKYKKVSYITAESYAREGVNKILKNCDKGTKYKCIMTKPNENHNTNYYVRAYEIDPQ